MYIIFVIAGIIALIINIIVLVKFFQLCKDVKTLNSVLLDIKAINAAGLNENNRYAYMKKRLFEVIAKENDYLQYVNSSQERENKVNNVTENYKEQINEVIQLFGFSDTYSIDDFKKDLFDKYKK